MDAQLTEDNGTRSAGVSQSTKRAAASVDVPAPAGVASGRSPPCFLKRVSFTGFSHIWRGRAPSP